LWTKDGVGPGTWWIQTEFGSTNIKVYGRGTMDGNGFHAQKVSKFVSNYLVPIATKNFQFDGPLLRDGSFWTVTVIQSEDVNFRNLKVINRRDIGENDGIDVVESSCVTVTRAISIAWDDSFLLIY
jgi:polygalacturonase